MWFPRICVLHLTTALLLAPLLAARVVQLEDAALLEAQPLGRLVPAAAAFQVAPGRLRAGPRARTRPLVLAAKRKKKKRPEAAGGESAGKGFKAPIPVAVSAPPRAKPAERQPSAALEADEYDKSSLELDRKVKDPGAVIAELTAGVPGAKTGRVAVEPVPGCEPVFAVASPEALEADRIGSLTEPAQYAQVKAALMALPPGDGTDAATIAFVEANRDLLDYRFLYMLTSEKLRADNTGDNATAEALQAARVRAVKATQKFDTALYKQVAAAETRLGGVLSGYMSGKPPDAKGVRAAVGETPLEIFAFWFVLKAAEVAWESKATDTPQLAESAAQKLGDLAEVRGVLEAEGLLAAGGAREVNELFKMPDLSGYYTGGLNGPEVRAAATEAAARLAEMAGTEEERLLVVRRMGCLYCQAVRHSYSAYQPLVQRAAAMYDVLLYGELMPLNAVDIKSKPRETESGFVKMARAADPIFEQQGIEIPLFW